ncbi:MAG: O-antigen ligase family protein [Vicinamibacteraceae bacterium]
MSLLTTAFYGALTASLVLYVYRFAIGGMNLSAFRAVFLAWLAWLAVDVLRRRVRFERRLWPFALVVAALVAVNAVDFLTLGGYPALRRDIANHLVNVGLTGLVLVYVDTESRLHALLRAFVLSSIVTTAVTIYASVFDRLPFEPLIRSLGSSLGQQLAYVSDDAEFQRATSSFFDPNFYGIYSLLVVVAVVYLWLYDRPARWLAVFFAVNLTCLTLSLSRTAVVGVFAAMAVAFVLERRARIFAVATVVATVGLLYVSTVFQSHSQYEQWVKDTKAFVTRWTNPEQARAATAGRGPVAKPRARPWGDAVASDDIQGRVANTRSLATRMTYIKRGLAVFQTSPIWGRGSASLLAPGLQWSSAHVSYLTLLARYGVLGTLAYLAFLLLPVAVVWRQRRPVAHRFIVSVPIAALMVVYLSYDVLLFFEIQYLLFGVAWATAFNLPALGTREPAPAAAPAA